MKEHPLRRQPQQALLNLIKAAPGGHNHNLQSRPLQIPINPVLLERVQREVGRFEHGRLMSVCEAAAETLGAVRAGAEEHRGLPAAEFERDGMDYGGGRGGGEVEDDLQGEKS